MGENAGGSCSYGGRGSDDVLGSTYYSAGSSICSSNGIDSGSDVSGDGGDGIGW